MPIVLDEDSEFNFVIVVEKEKELDKPEKRYLVYQCDECKKTGQAISPESLLVFTEKIDELERVPKTPLINPFSTRNENLSFKEVLGGEKSPNIEMSPPTTSRSKFDFNFFQSPINFEKKYSRINTGSLESLSSPKKVYPANIKNIVAEKKKESLPHKAQKPIVELHESEGEKCRCFKIQDSGCSIYMSTPLMIKWSINHLFFTSSIYRIVWNFRDVEIINAVCRIISHYYKVGDKIEVEVEVENRSLNELDLELIPPSEVLQNSSPQDETGSLNVMQQEGQNEKFSLKKMENVLQNKIKNDQLMALATEKSIPYGKRILKPNDKKKMKMSLLALNHGTIKLDYLIFYEQRNNIYLKVQFHEFGLNKFSTQE